jgi:hypothetical protein
LIVLKCDIGGSGSGGDLRGPGIGHGLPQALQLGLALLLGLERFSRALAPLNHAQTCFDPFGELGAARAPKPFHQLFHPAIGPDPKMDGVLFHPKPGEG